MKIFILNLRKLPITRSLYLNNEGVNRNKGAASSWQKKP